MVAKQEQHQLSEVKKAGPKSSLSRGGDETVTVGLGCRVADQAAEVRGRVPGIRCTRSF